MQKLILPLLLALLCATSSFAQGNCNNYGYYIDLDGFVCGNGIGQICFVTSANWMNYNTCGDYVIELEYPTGSFIYTELGDFYLYSEGNGKTVLRHEPQVVSEGSVHGCLEGVLQVPGTVFTLRIVWPTNPNDVLSTTTFQLDAAANIGAPGQTTLVSAAIGSQQLLPYNQAQTTGQTVVIEGTLLIDEEYGFGSSWGGVESEVILKPGARIEVANGIHFGTFHADIHGCEDTWDRILLHPSSSFTAIETTVQDAAVAVEMEGKSSLTIGNVAMSNNNVGIGAYGPAMKPINLTILSSIFEGCTIQKGQEGCHFENVSFADLSGNLRIQKMTANGVYLDNTDMNGYYLSFYQCPIGINSATPNRTLTVDHCEFGNGEGGIRAIGALDMDVTHCFFHNLSSYGIGRGSGVSGEHSTIEYNVMAECASDVLAVVQPSTAEIQFNELAADQTNVGVWGYGVGSHQWAVQHNESMYTGLFNDNGYNVSFVNVRNGLIFKNDYALSSLYNFAVSGGSGVKIGYNVNATSFADNIRFNASPSSLIYCNSTDGNTGLTFLNDCSGAIVRGNQMTGSSYNLAYGEPGSVFASTGPQPYKGNMFDLSSDANPKAIHYSAAGIAQQDQYLVGFLSGMKGTALYPYFTSAFDKWFWRNENGPVDYQCPPGVAGEDPKGEGLKREIQNHTDLLDAGVEGLYGAEVAFDVQLKLFRALSELQKIEPLSAKAQNWYTRLATSPVASFIAFEQALQNASTLSASEASQTAQLNQEIRAIKADFSTVSWQNFDKMKEVVTINPVQKALYDNKVNALKAKSAALESILGARRQNLLSQLNRLDALNAGISGLQTTSSKNLKTVNTLLLRRMSAQFEGYTAQELQTLSSIANQCASIGGEGVFSARALLTETNMTVSTYHDDCLSGIVRREAPVMASGALSIAPNPVADLATILLPEGRNYSMLVVFDLAGRQVQQINLTEGQMTAGISTAALSPGLYFLAPQGRLAEATKFVVSR